MRRASSTAFVLIALLACAACGKRQSRPLAWPIANGQHQLAALNVGWDALLTRVAAIRSASSSIELQTFIWTNDPVGRLIAYELLQAADRGVRVRIIADQMFSDTDPHIVAQFASCHPNLSLKHYNPTASRIKPSALQVIGRAITDFNRLNQRMHNKIMVVDQRLAIVGGRNIENTYYDQSHGLNFKDREVIVAGDVALDIAESFNGYWNHQASVLSMDLIDVSRALAELKPLRTPEQFAVTDLLTRIDAEIGKPQWWRDHIGSAYITVERVSFLADLPGKRSPSGQRPHDYFAELLAGAEHCVVLQTPYLVLSRQAGRILGDLRERGVAVSVSTNSLAATDNWPSYGKYYQQKRFLVESLDLRVHEFKPLPGDLVTLWPTYERTMQEAKANQRPGAGVDPSFCLHAKSMVVDDNAVCIGSFNLDPRSMYINTETALVVWDQPFAASVRQSIATDMAPRNSWLVWKRPIPLGLRPIDFVGNSVNKVVTGLTTIDLWPMNYSTCFELQNGQEPVPPGDADFYRRFTDVGNFPGLPFGEEKRTAARLFKMFGGVLTPLL
jgi:phosphatidylserine/phosphatidylglycerophosphate/cardiolipin synthase-like enzyme